ncbi:MAG: TolC family protein [Thermaceae bacterium]|nr:TolC family protein [Thermaceae bacterium]
MRILRLLVFFFVLASTVWAQGTLSLEGALKALQSSPDWQSADLTYQSAQRTLEAAQAAAGLKVTPGASYTLADVSGTAQNSLILSASASLGVLPWTASADAVRAAQRALDRASLTLSSTRNTLYTNLTTQYFAARTAQQNNDLAQANLQLQENLERVAEAKYQNGQLSFSDLLTQQQALESARVNSANAPGNLEIARQTLANSLGIAAGSLGSLTTAPTEPTLPAGTLETLIAQALKQRPDVLSAQSRLEDAQASLDSAQRDRWVPASSVTLGYAQRSTTTGTANSSVSAGLDFKTGSASLSASVPVVSSVTTGSNANVLSLGLSVALPLLDPTSDASVNSNQTTLSLTQLALESAQRAATLDVRQKYQQAQTAKAQVGIAKAALATASQTLKTAQAKLTAGTGTALDVQNAQVNAQQAQVNLESAIATSQTAFLALQNALGINLAGGSR